MKKSKVIGCVLLLVLILVLTVFSLTACQFAYGGKHRDLYTVAVNNIFGAQGYVSNGEATFDPTITIIETDDYGRVLFFYDEYYYGGQNSPYGTAIAIMQKSDNKYAYYYQDDCYCPYFNQDRFFNAEYGDMFSEEDIQALKELNDWNKELDLDKCTKSRIATRNPWGKLNLKDGDFNAAIKPFAQLNGYKGSDAIYRYSVFCHMDDYGRELFYVYGIGRDANGTGTSSVTEYQYFNLAMIFNPDKTCPVENILAIEGVALSLTDLKALKETACWNQPFVR